MEARDAMMASGVKYVGCVPVKDPRLVPGINIPQWRVIELEQQVK